MQALKLTVDGMTCGGCVASVKRVLEAQPGVSGVSVSLEAKEARFSLDDSSTTLDSVVSAIEDAGFDVIR